MPPEGELHVKPNDKCAKMCRRYVGPAIYKVVEWKTKPGKSYRKILQGVQQPPIGCMRRVEAVEKFKS